LNARTTPYTAAQLAERNDPTQPFITGDELEQVIALANQAMREDIEGVTLRMHSPHDLDAEHDDREPLTPGVRRMVLCIDSSSGQPGVVNPETVQTVFMLYVIGKGPNLQLDAERVLQWVARVEQANGATVDAAGDINDPAVVRGLVYDRLCAKDMAKGLAAGGKETNRVADEVRAAVADHTAWSLIKDDDVVVVTKSLYRARGPSV
jgi:hypothetical protein